MLVNCPMAIFFETVVNLQNGGVQVQNELPSQDEGAEGSSLLSEAGIMRPVSCQQRFDMAEKFRSVGKLQAPPLLFNGKCLYFVIGAGGLRW